VAALIALQDEYRALARQLPNNLEGSKLADRLQAVAKLDLEELRRSSHDAATATAD
jgi:hypothetical protein